MIKVFEYIAGGHCLLIGEADINPDRVHGRYYQVSWAEEDGFVCEVCQTKHTNFESYNFWVGYSRTYGISLITRDPKMVRFLPGYEPIIKIESKEAS